MRDRAVAWLTLLAVGMLAAEPASPAVLAWEKGQEALRQGHNERAIAFFRQSLQLDPALARNHLSLAAAYVGQGLDEQAAPHFALYLAAQPDHLVVRVHYADVLLRLGQLPAARTQFERFVAEVQDHPDLANQHLVRCHSRLMEIAEVEDDEYAEHLNRGIGLFLLGGRRTDLSDPEGRRCAEGLLFKAAGELMLARARRPDEARPCWYLHEVWSQLAQNQPAARWLRAAEEEAPFSYLTPAERRALQLAVRLKEREGLHK
jgi:tetratricopeptide (TPR) repeat protein